MKMVKLVLVLMFFLGGNIAAKNGIKVPEIKMETVYINGNKNYEVVKPIFIDNVKFKTVNDELNTLINTEELKKEEEEIESEDPEGHKNHELFIQPTILYADSDIISFTISGYQYTGGAHGGSWLTSFLVNRKTGEIITDTLKTENKKVFNKIQKYIKENPEGIFFGDEYTSEYLMNEAVVSQLDKDTISISYMSYIVAPYAVGMPEFEYNTKTKKLYFMDASSGEGVQKIRIK